MVDRNRYVGPRRGYGRWLVQLRGIEVEERRERRGNGEAIGERESRCGSRADGYVLAATGS
jgi:hypothetical protein